jgi:hypothetical protein
MIKTSLKALSLLIACLQGHSQVERGTAIAYAASTTNFVIAADSLSWVMEASQQIPKVLTELAPNALFSQSGLTADLSESGWSAQADARRVATDHPFVNFNQFREGVREYEQLLLEKVNAIRRTSPPATYAEFLNQGPSAPVFAAYLPDTGLTVVDIGLTFSKNGAPQISEHFLEPVELSKGDPESVGMGATVFH